MKRGYQHGFSDKGTAMFDVEVRRRKAATMVKVISECCPDGIEDLSVLNVGGSAGIIDEYLARHFREVVSVDIDEKAIAYAQANFEKENLRFAVGDAMDLDFEENTFDVAVCSQVYEHVPDAPTLMAELERVLKPGGLIYFAAGNRLMFNEPHYDLPFLSVLPRRLSHIYLRLSGRGTHYYEKHLTYWGLKSLVKDFEVIDFTRKIIERPDKYDAAYLLRPGSRKQRTALIVAKYLIWLVPGYIWVLRKQPRS